MSEKKLKLTGKGLPKEVSILLILAGYVCCLRYWAGYLKASLSL